MKNPYHISESLETTF
jgi:hypothetical protein